MHVSRVRFCVKGRGHRVSLKRLSVIGLALAAQLALAACSPASPPTAAPTTSAVTTAGSPVPVSSPAAASSPAASPGVPSGAASPAASPAAAQPAQTGAVATPDAALASVWQGKNLSVVVSENPGGGADAAARLMSRYMGKYLPGNPNIVIQNMPGASSRIAANFIYQAKPDGLTMGMVSSGIPGFQLAGEGPEQGVRYDVAKFLWIGSPTVQTQAIVLHQRAGVTTSTLDLLKSKTVTVAGQTPGETTHGVQIVLNQALGWKIKTVFGYEGLPGRLLGIDRGEVDGLIGTWDSLALTKKDDLQSHTLLPLVQVGREKTDPFLVGVPNAEKLMENSSAESKQLLALVARPYEWARPFMAPPETPLNVTAALRAAFNSAVADPEFQAEAAKIQLDVVPVSGERMQEGVAEYLKTPRSLVDRLQELIAAETPQ